MKRLMAVLILAAVLLMSCAPKIKEGEIYNKKHHPAHTVMMMVPITHTTGKSTFTTLQPIFFFYPEAWSISYKLYNKHKNKWETATVWVSREGYEGAQLGGWYERTDKDLDDQPRIRQKKAEERP